MQYLKDKIEFVNEQVKMLPVSEIITKQGNFFNFDFPPIYTGKPICIKETENTIAAFTKMTENNISGLGVVDLYGALVDVITIKDLRSITMDESMRTFH